MNRSEQDFLFLISGAQPDLRDKKLAAHQVTMLDGWLEKDPTHLDVLQRVLGKKKTLRNLLVGDRYVDPNPWLVVWVAEMKRKHPHAVPYPWEEFVRIWNDLSWANIVYAQKEACLCVAQFYSQTYKEKLQKTLDSKKKHEGGEHPATSAVERFFNDEEWGSIPPKTKPVFLNLLSHMAKDISKVMNVAAFKDLSTSAFLDWKAHVAKFKDPMLTDLVDDIEKAQKIRTILDLDTSPTQDLIDALRDIKEPLKVLEYNQSLSYSFAMKPIEDINNALQALSHWSEKEKKLVRPTAEDVISSYAYNNNPRFYDHLVHITGWKEKKECMHRLLCDIVRDTSRNVADTTIGISTLKKACKDPTWAKALQAATFSAWNEERAFDVIDDTDGHLKKKIFLELAKLPLHPQTRGALFGYATVDGAAAFAQALAKYPMEAPVFKKSDEEDRPTDPKWKLLQATWQKLALQTELKSESEAKAVPSVRRKM